MSKPEIHGFKVIDGATAFEGNSLENLVRNFGGPEGILEPDNYLVNEQCTDPKAYEKGVTCYVGRKVLGMTGNGNFILSEPGSNANPHLWEERDPHTSLYDLCWDKMSVYTSSYNFR